jgi:hypothetical protein
MRFDFRRTIRLVSSNLSANFCIVRDFDVGGSHRPWACRHYASGNGLRFDLNQTENAEETHYRRMGLVFDP